jgi:adenine phosphoribosyltransferase
VSNWRTLVREIPDFPKPGILFRDVLPALTEGAALAEMVSEMADEAAPFGADLIVAPEARGFLLAAALATRLQVGVLPIRKPGKLPGPVLGEDYALEYGDSRLEMEALGTLRGRRGLIVDDVLATGGTVSATARLLERAGVAPIGLLCLLELKDLRGRERLEPALPVRALWVL